MSASGNITAATYFGSGAGLTSVAAATATTAATVTTNAQPNITSVGTLTGLTVTNTITGNITGSAATATTAGTVTTNAQPNITSVGTLTSVSVTGNITGGNIVTANATIIGSTGTISALGNITGGNIVTANATIIGSTGTISALGNITGGNIIGTHVGNLAGTTVSASGNITGGNLITAGLVSLSSITKTGSNSVGNIGQTDNRFNTIFATATSALYADLAEMYVSDAVYVPGTVVIFGGSQEVTVSDQSNDTKVAGVVSTNPAYIMNSGLDSEFVVAVALQGRVPTRVAGTVRKGDIMVSSANGHAEVNNTAKAGTILGKALENFDGITGVIEVVVGRV
jgi:hypothetical protein